MLLEDKIILISGGTRGLCAGIARAAAAHGATGIMITGRDRTTGEALAAELAGNSADIRFIDRSGVITGSVIDWDQKVLGCYD
jgi:NAD(P)-dependent dehydrogenase (short-subunit alcohol dehydrogenase family)